MTQILVPFQFQEPQDTVPKSGLLASVMMETASVTASAALLAKTPLLGSFDANDRRAMIEAVVEVLSVRGDRPISIRAQPSSHLQLLVEGWAYRSCTLPNGACQITDLVLPGDLCVWTSPESHETEQELRACGPARVAVLRKDVVAGQKFFRRWHSWERALDVEARILRSRLVSLGRRDARARTAHLMSEFHHRLHRVGLSNGGAFDCPLTQEQLADVLGLSYVHINRVLKGVRREGLIMFKRPRVVIPDLARLHVSAGFNGAVYDG